MTDVPEFSVRGRIGGRGYDASRSFLEKAVSFPENINVEITQTFTGGAEPAAGGGGGGGRAGAARGMRGSSGTVLTHHSMVKLPEKPMMPRLFDERVGYFTQGLTDYGTDEHRSVAKRYIARYRLEKKDPNAEISEPVKPIVVLHRSGDAEEVGAVREEGHRGLAAGVRGRRVPQCDRRARSAAAFSRSESR